MERWMGRVARTVGGSAAWRILFGELTCGAGPERRFVCVWLSGTPNDVYSSLGKISIDGPGIN